jgi:hypothetical protein
MPGISFFQDDDDDDCAAGKCTEDYINEGHPCNDGNKCTINDVCTHGVCMGVPKACTSSTCVDHPATLTQVKVTPPYPCCLLRELAAALSLRLKLRLSTL